MTEPQWESRPIPAHMQPVLEQPRPMPPGWYQDPSGAPHQRWWDGQQWTGATQGLQPAVAPHVVTTYSHKKTSHGLHIFLTIITGGLWGIVWLAMVLWHRSHKGEKTVTRVGY